MLTTYILLPLLLLASTLNAAAIAERHSHKDHNSAPPKKHDPLHDVIGDIEHLFEHRFVAAEVTQPKMVTVRGSHKNSDSSHSNSGDAMTAISQAINKITGGGKSGQDTSGKRSPVFAGDTDSQSMIKGAIDAITKPHHHTHVSKRSGKQGTSSVIGTINDAINRITKTHKSGQDTSG